jgi:hypothetical protein
MLGSPLFARQLGQLDATILAVTLASPLKTIAAHNLTMAVSVYPS